jgi:Uma2 family endonuclease
MQFVVDKFETFAGVVLQPGEGPLTDEQFLALCERYPDYRIESTVEGDIIIRQPAHPMTSRRNAAITRQLDTWAEEDGRGDAYDSSAGFFLVSGARRSADSTWISKERMKGLEEDDAMWHATPEFAIELRSKSDRIGTLRAKLQEWIDNGVSLAWLIDPKERTVEIYSPGVPLEVLKDPVEVAGEGPVAGFVLKMARVW